jgi:hypothetical protein
MRRSIRAAWLVVLVVTGCETVGRSTRAENRERELLQLNEKWPGDQQVVPRTIRERADPLLSDPTSWDHDQRSQRK